MGYRSDGMIYLSEEAQELLTDELKFALTDWKQESDNIWSFEDWKWYYSYPDVKIWEEFMNMLEEKDIEYDFARIGEEVDDVEIANGFYFYVNRTIGFW